MVMAAVGTRGGDVSSYGSAHPGHAPAAALSCRPRAVPVGGGWRHAPAPPCDRGGRRTHEPRTPTPTRNHHAHVAPRRADARPCLPPVRPTAAPMASSPTPWVQYAKLCSTYVLRLSNLRPPSPCVTSP